MDLKIKDLAELLNVSETTIRRWIANKKIPVYRLNHQYRFSRIEIENWMLSCKMNHKAEEFSGFKDKVPDIEKVGFQKFGLFRAVHKGDVLFDIEDIEKEALIKNSMTIIAESHELDADVVTDLLLDRESLMPTSLNNGVAVPHTRDFLLPESYDMVSCVFLKNPIDYGALDGKPVHTLFFLFASNDKNHLHLLAKLAHLVSDKKALDFLKTRPQKQDLLSYLKSWETSLAMTQVTSDIL